MNKKTNAFTLIELLVVIVIIGILATISTATYSQMIAKGRDAKRQTAVAQIAKIVEGSSVDRINQTWTGLNTHGLTGSRYTYLATEFKGLLERNGVNVEAENNICYFFTWSDNQSYSPDGEFIIATWGESTSTAYPGTPGPIYDGTVRAKENFAQQSTADYTGLPGALAAEFPLTRDDFDCQYYNQRGGLSLGSLSTFGAYNPYFIFSGGNSGFGTPLPSSFNVIDSVTSNVEAYGLYSDGTICLLWSDDNCY